METTSKHMSSVTEATGVRREISRGAIMLDKIFEGEFQKKGTLSAQIRQEIVTKSFYPSKKVSNEARGNIFTTEDFGFDSTEFESKETRMDWLPVPENATVEQVQKLLDAAYAGGATIYRVLSNQPIITSDQAYSIEQGQKTLNDYANAQVVRYPEGAKVKDANGVEQDVSNQLIVDKDSNVKYRKTFFWKDLVNGEIHADSDLSKGTTTCYKTPEIKAELEGASVIAGQRLM